MVETLSFSVVTACLRMTWADYGISAVVGQTRGVSLGGRSWDRMRNSLVTPTVTNRNGVPSLAMAEHLFGEQAVRTCPTCGTLGRLDARAVYCSPACRQSAYRSRKKHQVKRHRCIF